VKQFDDKIVKFL